MTMKTPEMEVIRFNEADVLAASGENRFVTVAGLGTGIVGDATWTYKNGHTSTTGIDTYMREQDEGTLKGDVVYNISESQSTTLGAMVSGGDANGLFTEYNGLYETYDKGATWHKIQ